MRLSLIVRIVTCSVAFGLAASAACGATGAEIFADHCAPCHGLDGKARTPAGRKVGAKDLSESKLSDAEIQKQILNGAKNERGVEKMPSFREKIPAAEIDLLVAYVKTFRH